MSWNIASGDMTALPFFQQNQATALARLEPVIDLRPKRPEVSNRRNQSEQDDEIEHDVSELLEGRIRTASGHSENQKRDRGNLSRHFDLSKLGSIYSEALC